MPADLPYKKRTFTELTQALLDDLEYARGSRTALTDTTEGSVVRTLVEAFSRELAVCYEQLDRVYRFGFLDTAEGVALDNVVALLGIKRRGAGHIEGEVLFYRSQPAPEDIPIPTGTLISGRDIPLFETVERTKLAKDTTSVRVAVRSLQLGEDKIEAGKISVMPRPILGVETVNNPTELLPRQREETDEELRERARNRLNATNLGTKDALKQTIIALGLKEVHVQEHPGEARVTVIIGDRDVPDALLQEAKEQVETVRPAGIPVEVMVARRLWVKVAAVLEMDNDYRESKKESIRQGIEAELRSYFDSLGVGQKARWTKVRNILTRDNTITEVHPAEGSAYYMEPFERDDNVLKSMASGHVLKNRDLMARADERLGLDLKILPIELTLEPPSPDLWIDLILDLASEQSKEGVEESVRRALEGSLEKLPRDEPISFKSLAEIVPETVRWSSARFTLIHAQDGRVVELQGKDDQDTLSSREVPQLRTLTIEESSK